MKKILRLSLINSICLAFIAGFYPGLNINQGIKGIFLAGIGLTLINKLLRPLLKTLLLPLSLLTFGTLNWIINAINIAVLGFIIPQFRIKKFFFSGFKFQGISLSGFYISSFLSLIFVSILLKLSKKIFLKVMDKQ